jgi:four helix bundle protein
MTNDNAGKGKVKYDLEERTARFGEAVIIFAKKVPQNVVTLPLIGQLVRAGTSVGANYCEADDAVSKKEFRCKIDDARRLWQEAKELHLIFASIYRK